MNNKTLTFNGAEIDFLKPDPSKINITDIAKGLSNTCRYGGQINEFYSVAQHSVVVAEHASPQNRLAALLHDAPEFILGDPVTHLKPLLPDYRKIENWLHLAICDKFDLDPIIPDEIKKIDKLICHDEMATFSTVNPYPSDAPRLGVSLEPWSPKEAYAQFMRAYVKIKRTLVAC